jgi:phosphinothricin acetyltransferase
MSDGLAIRDAREQDLPAILAIHNEAVLNTTAVWDEAPRTLAEQQQWLAAKRAAPFPVLVAECEGEIAGYASYGPFRAWYGYRHTVENSIYVHSAQRRRGVGERMLAALIERARTEGCHVMIAGIEARNEASLRLHTKLGYAKAAHLHEVGFKFDRWLDLVLLELRL